MKPTSRRVIGLVLFGAGLVLAGYYVSELRKGRAAGRDPALQRAIPRAEQSLLLVTVDTTRTDRLEPYGAKNVATPTLARLAAEGILLEHAYSVAPITLVAHTSVLTGLYPPQHGVRNNGTHYVPPDLTTLAERLRARGYRTGAFVSASVLERRYGLDQGFEVYDDDLSTGRGRYGRVVPDRPAEATVASARAWLDGIGKDERFFLWIHLYDPHAQYSPPPPFRDEYRERLYDGEIAYMDSQIGRLLEHPRLLRGEPVLTTVIGDHGESLGEHGEETHAILAYDATLHIPWLLRIPDGPAGLRVQAETSQVDLVPTVLDLLGLDADSALPGRSLARMLERPDARAPRLTYSETYLPYYTYRWAKVKVARSSLWKYIDAPTPELYNLRKDPRELANVLSQQPGVGHDLERDLGEFLATIGDPERETELALDSESIDKLLALGYVGLQRGDDSAPDADQPLPDPKDLIGLHVQLERARRLIEDRLPRQAAEQLNQALEKDPNNVAALIDLATALEQSDEIDAAMQTAERALALMPSVPRLHLLLAGIEARRGNREQALKLVDAALELDPKNVAATIQKVWVLQQLGRRAEVRELLDKALAEHPDIASVQANYAQLVHLPAGDLAAAESKLRAAIARDPFLAFGWRMLGDVLERGDRLDEAVSAYSDGLKRASDDPELHARLGLLLARTGGSPQAEVHLREALRLNNEFRADIHVALGAWLADHNRLQEADAEYELVLKLQPKHPGARNNRAIAMFRRGQTAEALAELDAVVREFPNHADAHNNLAGLAVAGGQWAVAERHARKALELNPAVVEAWNNLGLALEEQGSLDQALPAYDHALAIDSGYWRARHNRAVVLRKLGQDREAATGFEAVVALVPTYREAHLELGDLYAGKLADPALARAHYNAFLRASRDDPRGADVKRRLAGLGPSNRP